MTDVEDGKVVLLAAYETADYEGYASVVWFERGKLYLVKGSHCSCMGLEEQFEPEETHVDALIRMAQAGQLYGCGGSDFIDLLRGIKEELEAV